MQEASSRAFECLPSLLLLSLSPAVCARTAPSLSLSHTHTHPISCCSSITGGWILFIMAWRSCFLFHSIGLPCKPAYALSATSMIGYFCSGLHTRMYIHTYTHGRNFVFFWLSTFALPYIYSLLPKIYTCMPDLCHLPSSVSSTRLCVDQ
jgi:hypothetical protein